MKVNVNEKAVSVTLTIQNERDRALLLGFLSLDPLVRYGDEEYDRAVDDLDNDEMSITECISALSEAVSNDSVFDGENDAD